MTSFKTRKTLETDSEEVKRLKQIARDVNRAQQRMSRMRKRLGSKPPTNTVTTTVPNSAGSVPVEAESVSSHGNLQLKAVKTDASGKEHENGESSLSESPISPVTPVLTEAPQPSQGTSQDGGSTSPPDLQFRFWHNQTLVAVPFPDMQQLPMRCPHDSSAICGSDLAPIMITGPPELRLRPLRLNVPAVPVALPSLRATFPGLIRMRRNSY